MNRNITSVVIKLFVLSLLVGLAMSFLEIRPETLLADLGGTAVRIFNVLVDAVKWAVPYVMVGAVVVVPLWLVTAAVKLLRRRDKK